jgi:ABC-type nitrate/sulfonate/bicarbonate transport system substrate-binding protein
MMPKAFVATLLILVGSCLPAGEGAAEPVQKVRIGYPSSAVSTLPFDIAKEKGFYSKAGLEVEYIQMRTAIVDPEKLVGFFRFASGY